MTDREMLMLAYGALKADISTNKALISILENYLFPKTEKPEGE